MKKLALLALLSAIALAPYGFGQASDGNVVGTVLDPTGAGIPSANVELSNDATGVKTTTKTGSDGAYRFGNVLVGTYTVNVTVQGFTSASLKNVVIDLSKTTTVNVSLSVGAVTSQVEVTSAVALLDTTTATISNTYESKLAAELPLAANRNGGIYNLALVGAGVSSAGGVGVGYGPSVGGQRPRNNNFMIDGVDNNRKDVTGPIIFIPNDGVAEFSILQNQFSAEFGHSSGGQFNAVLKSGSNAFHGNIYEYMLNRKLFANDESAARTGLRTPPRYDENRLGASAGAPIIRNKWFIFGDYEYNPLGQAGTPSAAISEPTTAGYAILDSMAAAGTISKTNLGILKQYAPGVATQTPGKTTTVNGTAIPIGIYQVTLPNFANTYNWMITSDFNISDKDQLRGRYISNRTVGLDIGAALPVFFTPRPTTGKLGSVSEFHSFSPTLSNEIRVAFNRYNDDIIAPDFKYPGLDVFPNIVLRDDLNLNIGPNPNAPQATVQTTYQIVDNVSWVKGKHDLKFGFDGRDLIAASTFIQRVRGDYEYTVLDKFLNDRVPNFISERNVGGKPYSGNNTAYYFFANDNIRLTRNFTLNLGLRWEFNGVAQSMKEFALNSIADLPGQLVFRAPEASKKNWQPRIGFAYSPGTSGRTSIRAGFGLAYDQIFDNVGTNARPPQATSTFDSPNPDDPKVSNFLATGGILPTAPGAVLNPTQARAGTSSYLPPNQQLGYALTWNFGIQHSFRNDYTVDIRYIGTKGVHLLFQNQINRNALVTPTFNIPTYAQMPSQATLAALPLTVQDFTNLRGNNGTNFAFNPLGPSGFPLAITAYVPRGNSRYNGLALDVKKRYAKNWLFNLGYTFSHLIDDSTGEVNSLVSSPRRPQDFNNISAEKANSALDHRNRFTFTSLYETPWFSTHQNRLIRNVVGNWELSGTYTVETGQWATAQSGVDSNQNGDAAADRVIINPNGTPGVGSGVTAIDRTGATINTSTTNPTLCTVAGQPVKGAGCTVAYVIQNPNAQYIAAGVGAFATGGRNTLMTPRINNIDFTIAKNIVITERWKLQLRADMFNAVNHPQYTLGRVNNVRARNTSGSANWFIPGNSLFGQWDQSFSSNPRTVQVTAKLTF